MARPAAGIDARWLDRLRIEEFYADYAACLDDNRLEEWPEFFTDDCVYGVWPRENWQAKLPAAMFYCTNKRMLRDRVVAHREANIFPVHWNRHFVSALRIIERAAVAFTVHSNYLIVQTRQEGMSFIYLAGMGRDRIVDEDGELKFVERRIIYDTPSIQTLFVTPV